jgi:hypothetical protein
MEAVIGLVRRLVGQAGDGVRMISGGSAGLMMRALPLRAPPTFSMAPEVV